MAHRKTRLQIRQAIRTNVDESVASFWSDANLNQFINNSKDRVALEVRKANQDYFEVTRTSLDGSVTVMGEAYNCADFQLLAGDTDYDLPHDFAEMREIRAITSGYEWLSLAYRRQSDPEFRDQRSLTGGATPRLYTILGERTLRVAPTPDVTLDLLITYVATVPDLNTDTEQLALPHPLYKAVQEYATAEALMMDRSPDAAAWEAKGNATVALFLGATERQATDYETVTGFLEHW